MPLVDAIRDHVFAAERLHADDTPVPVLAKTKTRLGRLWTYVRDDRPLPAWRRPPRCSSTPPIAATRIRGGIWPAGPA
jgi:transposase